MNQSMKKGLFGRASASSFVLGFAALVWGCGTDGVVGGNCKPGYIQSGDHCVASSSNTPSNVDPTVPTVATGSHEEGSSSGALAESNPPPKSQEDGGALDDGGPGNDAAADLADASDAQPPSSEDAAVPPELVCDAPFIKCRDECIPAVTDPYNCGACGRICPSNICIDGVCQGATPGDVVLIGHDMTQAWSGAVQTKVLVNAVSIPTTDPIRVLSYESGANPATAAWTRTLLDYEIRREVQFTTASADAVDNDNLYASYDVVLVHGAANADPSALGNRWAAPLQKFTKRGGVFVAIDGGQSDVPSLVKSAGLLDVSGHQLLSDGTHFVVTSAVDVVGAQLLSPYASFGPTVGFFVNEQPSADVNWVVRMQDNPSLPVVVHKTAR